MNRRRLLTALAAAALPFGVSAQRKPRRVALLSATATPDDLREAIAALKLTVDARSAAGRFTQLEKLAAEAVRAKPDVIVAHETPAVAAAAKATERIPIVMAPASERVDGANITGLVVDGTRYAAGVLNLVREVKGNARRIALLANGDDPSSRALLASLNQAAARIRVPVGVARVRGADDYEAAFAQWDRLRVQVVIAGPTADLKRAAELALRYRLPAIALASGFVEAGGLASYSVRARDIVRRVPGYVERILNGIRPRDLPVEPLGVFELAVNLKTARAIEIDLPDGLLGRADAVIQ
ncbi:MAG TPA: ABC transporter substrate-binding protein [Burkholderiales bacterium]|nr:ABC transporter substrate-binding protein [Burkholderiales bacterium]